MDAVSLVGWVIVWTLGWAGTAKLKHRESAAAGITQFLAPIPVPDWAGWGLGLAELAVAFALAGDLVFVQGQLGSVASCVLFVVFGLGLLVNLARGHRHPCRCFGGQSPRFSYLSLIRSLALAAAAGWLVVSSLPDLTLVADVLHGLLALSLVATAGVLARAVEATRTWSQRNDVPAVAGEA